MNYANHFLQFLFPTSFQSIRGLSKPGVEMRWKKFFPEHLHIIWGGQSISPPEFEDQGCAGKSKIWADALEKIFSRASTPPQIQTPRCAGLRKCVPKCARDVPAIFRRRAGFEMRWFWDALVFSYVVIIKKIKIISFKVV